VAMDEDLEHAWQEYMNFVELHAKWKFETVILPWLKKNSYDFIAGNGTFFIGNDNLNIDPDSIQDEKVRKTLQIEVPGLYANDLGSLMPDYEHPKE
jgi:hypothetical protein